jgi:Tol biopolymer transport system component
MVPVKIKSLSIALLVLFLLAACGGATPTVTTPTAAPLPPTPSATPTATAVPSPTPTPVPALTGSGGGVIAFTAISASNERISEIDLVNADGSGLQSLPNSGGSASGWAPAWSPDGRWIAYIVHQSDNNWPMYIIGSDGNNRQQLLTGDLYHFPSWSPDGTQLACSRNGNLWIMDVAVEGNTITIADQRQLTFLDRQDASVPSWSPDGRQIVFASMLGDARGTADYFDPNSAEIYIVNADGTDLHKLTDDAVSDSAPDWSPDGSQIVFASARDGDYEIYVMDADGRNIRPLTDDPASDGSPAWSPDGTQIVFASDRDGNNEIYVMNADGSDQVRLTNTPLQEFMPAWRPETTLSISAGGLTAIVPLGSPAALDGTFAAGEWDRALQEETTDGGDVLLMHDDQYLYVGVHAPFDSNTATTICIEHEGEVSLLHSSGSLGTAIFAPIENGWQLTQPFDWELFGVTSFTAAAETQRQSYLERHGWLANLGSMTTTGQIEFKIGLPERPFRLAVAYLLPPDGEQAAWWPAGLSGDCRNIPLLQGNSGEDANPPLQMQFAPETWVTFTNP